MTDRNLDYHKLMKEAFWDYNLSKDDLFKTARSGSFREKKNLFKKILFNSSDRVRFIEELFSREDIGKLFESLSINRYNRYAERTVQLAKYFILDKRIRVTGLEWSKI